MRNRIARVVLGGAVAVLLSTPMTAPSHAWTCLGDVGQALCLVVGTSCRAVDKVTHHGELCTFG